MRDTPADLQRAEMIREHGWAVILVGEQVPWGYTVGISRTFGKPELFISGLHTEDIHAICNLYGDAVKRGEVFEEGDVVDHWLEGERMALGVVHDAWKPYFMGIAVDDLGEFEAFQAVWSLNGVFPWEGWPESAAGLQFNVILEPQPGE